MLPALTLVVTVVAVSMTTVTRPAGLRAHHTRRQVLCGAASATALPATVFAAVPYDSATSAAPSFDSVTRAAFAAFTAGEYARAEREWREASRALPNEPLVWINFGTVLIILASDAMTLGAKPVGTAAEQLQEALVAFDAAERLVPTHLHPHDYPNMSKLQLDPFSVSSLFSCR